MEVLNCIEPFGHTLLSEPWLDFAFSFKVIVTATTDLNVFSSSPKQMFKLIYNCFRKYKTNN